MDWETWFHHSGTYLANGLLAVFYCLWSNGPALLSLLGAAGVLLVYDRQERRVVGDRVRRYGRGERIQASRRSHGLTLVTAASWTVAALLSAPPIPLIGASMWVAFLVALRYIPQERSQLLFRQKTMILGYALIALAMQALFSYSPDLSRLAAVMGSRGDAAALFSTLQDGLMPYAALVVWVMYPLGYFGMIAQRFAVNRGSLLKPGGTAEDYIRDLRTRGEGR